MKKRQENREKKQAAILAAALGVFSEKGFAAAKIIDIAAAAKVGKGTIYEYFRSKDDLFFCPVPMVYGSDRCRLHGQCPKPGGQC